MNKDSRAYTVSQVNRYIANMFSSDFALKNITIQGEISNLKYHPTGHIYFTLKDAASQISGIMFAGDRAGLPFKLENGMRVLCTGSVGVYERGGSYQIYAKRFMADGIGDLYVRFEQLKKELEEMGLFDPMYKKPIPKYAQRIGVVTAKTGADLEATESVCGDRPLPGTGAGGGCGAVHRTWDTDTGPAGPRHADRRTWRWLHRGPVGV